MQNMKQNSFVMSLRTTNYITIQKFIISLNQFAIPNQSIIPDFLDLLFRTNET